MLDRIVALCLSAALVTALSVPPLGLPRSGPATAATAEQTTIRKSVEEVQVVFTVEDARQRLVRDVAPADITVLEDGRPAPAITEFRQNSGLPLRLALLVDRSDSMQKGFAKEQQAAEAFLERLLRPGRDAFFLLDFANQSSVSQPALGGAQLLSTKVESLQAGGQTALYDALYEACRQPLLSTYELQPVRRVMILLSDGEDTLSRYSLDDAIEAAQRGDIAIYAITAHSRRYAYPGDAVLRQLAEATGGRAFLLPSFEGAAQVFAGIEEELRTQYSVSFRPRTAGQCGYHSVRILHRNRQLRVRARDGYYACGP